MPETMSPRDRMIETLKRIDDGKFPSLDNQADAILAALASSGDHAELARLAEAATPGPWKAVGTIYEHMNCEVRGGAKGEGQAIAQVWDSPNAFKDGQFIAAANPAAVLALLAENAALRAACAKSNDEICQTLGKALGYPWFKDDQVNFPGADDENGVCVGDHVAESLADEAARRITEAERKLAEAAWMLRRWQEMAATEDVQTNKDGLALSFIFGVQRAIRTFLSSKESERG